MKPNAAKVFETACYEDETNKTSSSAQTVASIDDLLLQIFLYIPLKPLFRLKLISKHWNFIISDQNFNLLRNQNPINPAVGLIFSVTDQWHYPSSYVVSFDKPTSGPQFRTLEWPCKALSSCNGLLLCQRRGYGDYFVCNPTTNKHFKLPRVDDPPILCSMSLAFDPSKSTHYKVVCVVTSGTYYGHPVYLEVYSSETGCWIKHSKPFSGCADFCRGVDWNSGIYWNGAIHWFSTVGALYFNPDNDRVLQGVLQVMPTPLMITRNSLCFNPDNDGVPQVLMPTPPMVTPRKPPYWSRNDYFGESCGHLHYIQDYNTVMELNVYELRTDYSEWFVKYRVDCLLTDNRLASKTRALVRGKKDEDSFLVLQIGKRIIRYNLVYKTRETICELDATGVNFDRVRLHPLQYIESLSHV